MRILDWLCSLALFSLAAVVGHHHYVVHHSVLTGLALGAATLFAIMGGLVMSFFLLWAVVVGLARVWFGVHRRPAPDTPPDAV